MSFSFFLFFTSSFLLFLIVSLFLFFFSFFFFRHSLVFAASLTRPFGLCECEMWLIDFPRPFMVCWVYTGWYVRLFLFFAVVCWFSWFVYWSNWFVELFTEFLGCIGLLLCGSFVVGCGTPLDRLICDSFVSPFLVLLSIFLSFSILYCCTRFICCFFS